MKIGDFLTPELVVHQLSVSSRKKTIESVATLIAERFDYINSYSLFEKLVAREHLGSTALGEGIAIPHCRIDVENVTDSPMIIGAFVVLETPIAFDAIDQKPVDLLFFLVALGEQQQFHLDALAAVNGLLIDADKRQSLRNAADVEGLVKILIT